MTIEPKLSKQTQLPQLCVHLNHNCVKLHIHVCFTGQLRVKRQLNNFRLKIKLTTH